ncbi:MAG: hypothetical protein KA327_10025 [Pseudarcicella sp.]|nr:hypothetical protein [Pseudarcicella sp.]
MKRKSIIFIFSILLYSACDQVGSTIEITDNTEFFHNGEGYSGFFFKNKTKKSILWVKSFSKEEDSNFIFIWQADSVYINKPNRENIKRNTYYPNDKFHIYDIKREKLYSFTDRLLFMHNVKKLKCKLKWEPRDDNEGEPKVLE